MLLAGGLTTFILSPLFPADSLWGQLAPLILILPMMPFMAGYERWGTTWKLRGTGAHVSSTPCGSEANGLPETVRPWLRVASGILAFSASPLVFLLIRRPAVPWTSWLLAAILFPVGGFFGFAAVKGRAPHWFVSAIYGRVE